MPKRTLLLLMFLWNCSTVDPVEKIYHNGIIWTGDQINPEANAMIVRAEKIVFIGSNSQAMTVMNDNAIQIDLQGKFVTPGFIDNHCHFDAQITWDPLCTFSPQHGVTTVIFGNCSLTLAPTKPEDREDLAMMLSRVEAIPMESLKEGIPWEWTSFGEYLDFILRIKENKISNAGYQKIFTIKYGDIF